MTTVEEAREEFKETYKRLIIAQNGVWTNDDAETLELECKKIEQQSSRLAILIICLIYSGIVGLIYVLLKLMGIV